jgi:hypothetical protein
MANGNLLHQFFFQKEDPVKVSQAKQEYIPSSERPGFDESRVEKLPHGLCTQKKDYWGNNKARAWNREKSK